MTYPWEDLENEEYMYRIMIVEDDEVIANAIRQHLVSWGMEAFCVQDFSMLRQNLPQPVRNWC